MTAIGAILFIAAGVLVAVYVVMPAIEWLHDFIMGPAYRHAKRGRAAAAVAHRARWEEAEAKRLEDKRAREAEDLQRAFDHDGQQRAALRKKLTN